MRRCRSLAVGGLAIATLLVPPGAHARAAEPSASPSKRAGLRSHAAAEAALDRAQALSDGRGVVTGRELTPALFALAARYPALDAAERREADRLLARPTDGVADPQGDGYSVPEQTPACSTNFCFHWVTSTDDAPSPTDTNGDGVPNHIEELAGQFELSHTRQTADFGWRPPVPDGSRGGNGLVDVYVVDLAGSDVLGYVASDPGQGLANEKSGYVVMDDDYTDFGGDPATLMRTTAAHEYNHVLQLAYDAFQDGWLFESTAIWMEDRVHDDTNEYLDFLPAWTQFDEIPLARTFRDKHYGSGVWNMWLDARHGPQLIEDVWEVSKTTTPASFAPAAYQAALAAGGHDGFERSFGSFSAAVAEWRTAAQFPEGAAYPDAARRGSVRPGGPGVAPRMDHTTYALYTVQQPAGGWPAVLRLDGELPAGVGGALALVARTGASTTGGAVTTQLLQLPDGGQGSVQLGNPASFGRITAVLVNSDGSTSGFSQGDWVFPADGALFTAAAGGSASAAQAPSVVTAPSISGVPRDGSSLTAGNGGWSGSAPMTYARQWRRCDADGDDCADIPGATGREYALTAADVGDRFRVRVTASNGQGTVAADSAATEAVVPTAPANISPPVIDEPAPAVGDSINASTGTWSGSAPLSFTYQWRSCTPDGGGCADIPGANASGYTVRQADLDRALRVRVSASNASGSASRDSAITDAVVPSTTPPQSTAPPGVSVPAGGPRDGDTLTATAGVWTGSPAVQRRWLRCGDTTLASCAEIAGATGAAYVLGPGDVGSRMRVRERAADGAGTVDAFSAPTAAVTAALPVSQTLPAISGLARDDDVLTATDGTWTGTAPTFTRQWLRCADATLASCAEIAGATSPSYRLRPADVGARVRVRVVAANAAGSVTRESDPTPAVAALPVASQVATRVAGRAAAGSILSAVGGRWVGTPPRTVTRRWQRCDAVALVCTDVAGAAGRTYRLQIADVLRYVRVVVTVRNAVGSASVRSRLVGPIAGAPLATRLTLPGRGRVADALAGRLTAGATCRAACRVTARLAAAGGPVLLARGSQRLHAPGRGHVTLRPTPAGRERLLRGGPLRARVSVEVRDADGARAARRSRALYLRD